jgi:hypothetical protein
MKTNWGVEVQLHALLTSALDGGEWSASHSGCFTLRERAPGTHLTEGCVSPKAGLNAVVKRQNILRVTGKNVAMAAAFT